MKSSVTIQKQGWFKINNAKEKAIATLRVASVCIIFWYSSLTLPLLEDTLTTATTLIALPGTLTGFLMTAISLLVASADKPFIVNLRKTGHFETMIVNLTNSAASWVLVICIALSCHVIINHETILAIAISMMYYSLIYFAMTMNRFKLVIHELSKQ